MEDWRAVGVLGHRGRLQAPEGGVRCRRGGGRAVRGPGGAEWSMARRLTVKWAHAREGHRAAGGDEQAATLEHDGRSSSRALGGETGGEQRGNRGERDPVCRPTGRALLSPARINGVAVNALVTPAPP